jgi:glycosyltransferase involved in cell wall biosynthesis
VRVLFVLEYFPPHIGGVEALFAGLASGLQRRGVEVAVITLRLPGTPAREVLDGVTIVRVRAPRRLRRYAFTGLAFPAVLRAAAAADVVHTTTYNAALTAWLAGALRGKPVVVTVHEVFGGQWNQLLGMHPLAGYGFRIYERGLLHLPFAHFIADSDFTRGRLLAAGVAPGRATTIYPALDYAYWDGTRHQPRPLRAELDLPADTFVYLYFGRPGVSKGVEYLVRAAALVSQKRPHSRLVMLLADDPPERHARILSEVRARGLSGHVVVRDPVPRDDLPGYLLAADTVVVPSISEGFGFAALEAATLGCRVVSTRGHAVEEVLGEAALLVPPRDPSALAEAILAQEPGGPRPPPPRRYEAEVHVTAVLDLYKGLLGARRAAEPTRPVSA